MNRIPPHILLILATILWGGNFVIGRAVAPDIAPFTLAYFRWIVALLVFLPIAWTALQKEWSKIRANFGIVLLMSFTGVAVFNTLVYIALHHTSAINASLMNSTTPIVIFLLSFLFIREKLTKKQWIGAGISFVGVLFIISRGSLELITTFSFNIGDLIMVVAVLSWGTYSLLVKQFSNRLPGNATFLVSIMLGILMLTPFFIFEWMTTPNAINWSLGTLGAIIYIGIFASIVAFLSWNSGVVRLGASRAGIFLNFIPLFATIFAIIFIGESVQISQIVGALFVISGVYIATK